MRKILKLLAVFIVMSSSFAVSLSAKEFDTTRDYMHYTHGDGKVVVKVDGNGYNLENLKLYKIRGNESDYGNVNSNEHDDELIPVVSSGSHQVEWNIDEDGFYYISYKNYSRTASTAYGSDYVSCYLWLNSDENSTMNVNIHELP